MRKLYIILLTVTVLMLLGTTIGTSPILVTPYDKLVSSGEIEGVESFRKFGKNATIGTGTFPETIWETGGLKVWQTNHQRVAITSSSALDAVGSTGMDTIVIYGVDKDYNEISSIIPMNGTATVYSVDSFLNVHRGRAVGTGSNVGTISAQYESTTDPAFSFSSGAGQTQVGFFSVPSGKNVYINTIVLSGYRQGANAATVLIKVRDERGGGFRDFGEYGVLGVGSSTLVIPFSPPLLFKEKTDVDPIVSRVTINGTGVSIDFIGTIEDIN